MGRFSWNFLSEEKAEKDENIAMFSCWPGAWKDKLCRFSGFFVPEIRKAILEWYKESLVLKICQFFVSKCGV